MRELQNKRVIKLTSELDIRVKEKTCANQNL